MSSRTKTTGDSVFVCKGSPLTVVIKLYVSLDSQEAKELNCFCIHENFLWQRRNMLGRTALDHAVEVDSEEIILCLLDSGADMEREDPLGARPLDR
jgi:hypothetical protein